MTPIEDLFDKLIDIGEAADTICRRYPDHRCAMHLRDLAGQIEHGARALSKSTLEAIAHR
jgi:hypothetical protein